MKATILAEGFTPVIDALAKQEGLVAAAVFGRIWRDCQKSHKACFSALETIAGDLGVDRATVIRHIKTLIDGGYIEDKTPGLRNKPHTYIDTGKVELLISMTAGVAICNSENSGVANCNSGVAECNSDSCNLQHEDTIRKNKRKNTTAPEKEHSGACVSGTDPLGWFEETAAVEVRAPEDFGWLRHEYKPLAVAFLEAAGAQHSPLEKERKLWHKVLIEWKKLGLTPDVISGTVDYMRKEGLTIKSPTSVTGIARDRMGAVPDAPIIPKLTAAVLEGLNGNGHNS